MIRGSLAKRAVLTLVMAWVFATGFLLRGKPVGQWEATKFEGLGRASSSFAIADFDGDHKPDVASVKSDRTDSKTTYYTIHFRLSEGLQPPIGITARTGGLKLFWRDVNGDDALDLVVRTSLDSNLVTVLLNDGHGRFTQTPPEKFPGLEREPEFYFRVARHQVADGVSSLPSRTTLGENGEQASGSRLGPIFEATSAQENQSYCSFLSESGAGRSPPELS